MCTLTIIAFITLCFKELLLIKFEFWYGISARYEKGWIMEYYGQLIVNYFFYARYCSHLFLLGQ